MQYLCSVTVAALQAIVRPPLV